MTSGLSGHLVTSLTYHKNKQFGVTLSVSEGILTTRCFFSQTDDCLVKLVDSIYKNLWSGGTWERAKLLKFLIFLISGCKHNICGQLSIKYPSYLYLRFRHSIPTSRTYSFVTVWYEETYLDRALHTFVISFVYGLLIHPSLHMIRMLRCLIDRINGIIPTIALRYCPSEKEELFWCEEFSLHKLTCFVGVNVALRLVNLITSRLNL